MLALKKKREAEAKAKAEQQTPSSAIAGEEKDTNISSGDTSTPIPPSTTPKLSLFGVGGKKNDDSMSKTIGKKRTPGEIRIQKDIEELDGGTVASVEFPNPNDLTMFHVSVTPDSGFWKGATYLFHFAIPDHYPHLPPKVTCQTKIYHPNINLEGNVCLNILREDWKPVLDINAVIYGLIYLFYEPNPDDPLNHEAAELFRNDRSRFESVVKRTLRGAYVGSEYFERLI